MKQSCVPQYSVRLRKFVIISIIISFTGQLCYIDIARSHHTVSSHNLNFV